LHEFNSCAETFKDSMEKFEWIVQLCDKLDIYTVPKKINGVWIVPLFGWYSPYFDDTYDGDENYQKGWLDFYKIHWPISFDDDDVDAPAKYFIRFNEKNLNTVLHQSNNNDNNNITNNNTEETSFNIFTNEVVVTFSHFLPRFELLPSRLFIKKSLPLVVGYQGLDQQLRNLNSKIHVCGHTHINVDSKIDGVRYVQHALAHPSERKKIYNMSFFAYRPKLILDYPDTVQSPTCVVQ